MKASDYKKLSDEELIKLYQNGELAVTNYICEKYKPLVCKVSKPFFLIGAENEDLIQEGMIGLFNAMGDYDTSSEVTFFHFAELCIRRQMINAVDSSNTKKNRPLNSYVSLDGEDDEGTVADSGSLSHDPAEMLIEAEEQNLLVDSLLKALSPMERQVCELYLTGLNYKEIAKKLGKTDKSIDNTLTRIKSKAKDL